MNLLDVSQLRRQADIWHELLPRVEPFYAVIMDGEKPAPKGRLMPIWLDRQSADMWKLFAVRIFALCWRLPRV